MIENVDLQKVVRFAARGGHNTRQAIPALAEQGFRGSGWQPDVARDNK